MTAPLLHRARQVLAVARLRPFDGSTEAGRSQERYRRIVMTAIASAAARGVALVSLLVSVPLTMNYLGLERYGLWMTVSSLLIVFGFADLGLGNGLVNGLAAAHGRDETDAPRRLVSSALVMLAGVAMLIALAFAAVFPAVSWASLFNAESDAAVREAGPAVAALVACLAAALPLSVVSRVQLGYQEGFANSLWIAAGTAAGLAALLVAVRLRAGVPWLIVAVSGAPTLVVLAQGLVLFGARRPEVRPRWRDVTPDAVRRLLRLGSLFFVLQIAVAMNYVSDNLVVAHLFGPEAVTQYSVPMRLFTIPQVVLNLVLPALWPAYGEALARGDVAWARRTMLRSLAVTAGLSAACALVLLVFARPLLRAWVGPAIAPSLPLLAGLALWTVLTAVGSALAMFLNAANVVQLPGGRRAAGGGEQRRG